MRPPPKTNSSFLSKLFTNPYSWFSAGKTVQNSVQNLAIPIGDTSAGIRQDESVLQEEQKHEPTQGLPRKPRQASAFYVRDNYFQFRTTHPNLTSSEVRTLCERHWITLTAVDKAPYVRKREEDVERYRRELAALSVPSRPHSMFMLFRREHWDRIAAEYPGCSSAALVSILSQRYRLMTREDRARYHREAEVDRRRYYEAMATVSDRTKEIQIEHLNQKRLKRQRKQWKSKDRRSSSDSAAKSINGNTEADGSESTESPYRRTAAADLALVVPTIENIQELRQRFSFPSQPSKSFIHFFHDRLKTAPLEFRHRPLLENSRAIGAEWRTLSDVQKQPYVARYRRELGEWYEKLAAWKTRMIEDGNEEFVEPLLQIKPTLSTADKLRSSRNRIQKKLAEFDDA